jgi:hypothetical protein
MSLPKLGTHVFGSCAKARHRAPAWFSSIVLRRRTSGSCSKAQSRFSSSMEHDLFGKLRHSFPDHALKRDEIRLNRHHALGLLFEHDLSENRDTLFRIML